MTPEEPGDGYDQLVEDPVSGARSATGDGKLVFPQRSITLADDDAQITASTVPNLPEVVHRSLLELADDGFVSAPVSYTADPGVAENGVTITRTYPAPIPAGAFYSLVYWDTVTEAWVPVTTEISPDRRTLTARVDHLSWWSDLVVSVQDGGAFRDAVTSAGSTVIDSIGSVWDATSSAVRGVGGQLGSGVGLANEYLYQGVAAVFGTFAHVPDCTGQAPAWVLDYGNRFDDQSVYAPIKFCAGRSPHDSSLLEVKAALNRSYPMFFDTTPEAVRIRNTWASGTSFDNALAVLANPTSSTMSMLAAVTNGNLVMPGDTVAMEFSQDDVVANEYALEVQFDNSRIMTAMAVRLVEIALNTALGDALDSAGRIALGVGAVTQCSAQFAQFNSAMLDQSVAGGDLTAGVLGPVSSCLIGALDNYSAQLTEEAATNMSKVISSKRWDSLGKKVMRSKIILDLVTTAGEYGVWDNKYVNPDVGGGLQLILGARYEDDNGGNGDSRVTAISGVSDHTCAVLADRTVSCWGRNLEGQLGDGSTSNRSTPVEVAGLSDVTAVATGGFHTCALLGDRTVKCWGFNSNGQLGDGSYSDQVAPVEVTGLRDVTAIAAGYLYSCALLANGSVSCWGSNQYGQLGDGGEYPFGNRSTPDDVVGLTDVTVISAGAHHVCAQQNGRAYCWGNSSYGQVGSVDAHSNANYAPVQVSGLSDVASVSAGVFHSCAVMRGGTVSCWGHNAAGQLGDGSNAYTGSPVPVSGLSGAVTVSAGLYHTCAIVQDATLSCWGRHYHGDIGDGTDVGWWTPARVPGVSDVIATSTGNGHTCYVQGDGSTSCWGVNDSGQLGDGTLTFRPTPFSVVGM
ncbi:RCC1 domain-containing protein [Dietzia natronolimnaea]|uniref:RCC1 domain-containing protein n=1 Tax=Dietzia natronolimnaea TaxID=161920 RepID=UPI001595E7C6|nr:RCC1 domain-containing protein [Dietzia natronolimnaea]